MRWEILNENHRDFSRDSVLWWRNFRFYCLKIMKLDDRIFYLKIHKNPCKLPLKKYHRLRKCTWLIELKSILSWWINMGVVHSATKANCISNKNLKPRNTTLIDWTNGGRSGKQIVDLDLSSSKARLYTLTRILFQRIKAQ